MVTFDTQDGLEENIDRITTMISKLTAQDGGQKCKPKIFKVEEEDGKEISIRDVFMIREIIKIDIDQRVEIGEFHLVVEYSVDKIIETDWDMNRIIGMILGEETLEVI